MLALPQLPGAQARLVHPYRATKTYACPACGNTIAARTGHVLVVVDGDIEGRRHWHRHCWERQVGTGRLP